MSSAYGNPMSEGLSIMANGFDQRLMFDRSLRDRTRRHFFADCGVGLGSIALASLLVDGQPARAMEHYREAVRIRPDFGRANLSLGAALADSGDRAGGLPYLQKAAKSDDPVVRKEALDILARF